jgi:hypothetical protein
VIEVTGGVDNVYTSRALKRGVVGVLLFLSLAGALPITLQSSKPWITALAFLVLALLFSATSLFAKIGHGKNGVLPMLIAYSVFFVVVETSLLASAGLKKVDAHFVGFSSFLLAYSIFVFRKEWLSNSVVGHAECGQSKPASPKQ